MITSIMMATYNRLNLTKQTLDNLFLTINSKFNLIIIDNGSKDGTTEYLKELKNNINCRFLSNLDVFYNLQNRGIGTARNQALKIANKQNNQFLCTIDNDVLLPNNWLTEIIDIMNSNPNFSIGVNFEEIQYPTITLNNKTFQIKPNGNLGTALMVFPRQLHEKIGFFHDYRNYFGEEDADFGMRSRLAGYQLGYLKEPGTHIGSGEADKGEYRAFKDKCHAENLAEFRRNCALYASKQKPLYIPFDEDI